MHVHTICVCVCTRTHVLAHMHAHTCNVVCHKYNHLLFRAVTVIVLGTQSFTLSYPQLQSLASSRRHHFWPLLEESVTSHIQ